MANPCESIACSLDEDDWRDVSDTVMANFLFDNGIVDDNDDDAADSNKMFGECNIIGETLLVEPNPGQFVSDGGAGGAGMLLSNLQCSTYLNLDATTDSPFTLYSPAESTGATNSSDLSPEEQFQGSPSCSVSSFSPEAEASAAVCCQVCGSEAGKHCHYGAQVCNSCRAFFRRAVQTAGKTERFKCDKSGDCAIDSRSWRSCQWCRYQKCLTSGMNARWVLTEAERKARAGRRTAAKMLLQQQRTAVAAAAMAITPKYRTPSDLFTLEDEIYLRGLTGAMIAFSHKEAIKFYARNFGAVEEMLHALYCGGRISFGLMQSFENYMQYKVADFFGRTVDMAEVSQRDRKRLMAKNYPIVIAFTSSLYVDSHGDVEKYGGHFVSLIREMVKEQQQLSFIEDKMNEISLGNTLKMKACRYEQIFPENWARDAKAEERHKELTFKIREWPRSRPDDLTDEIQMMLLSLIILYSTDFVEDLENPSAVEAVQCKYAGMLRKMLRTKYGSGGGGAKFCKAMTVAAMSRELVEIQDKKRTQLTF